MTKHAGLLIAVALFLWTAPAEAGDWATSISRFEGRSPAAAIPQAAPVRVLTPRRRPGVRPLENRLQQSFRRRTVFSDPRLRGPGSLRTGQAAVPGFGSSNQHLGVLGGPVSVLPGSGASRPTYRHVYSPPTPPTGLIRVP